MKPKDKLEVEINVATKEIQGIMDKFHERTGYHITELSIYIHKSLGKVDNSVLMNLKHSTSFKQ